MLLADILPFTRSLVEKAVRPGDVVIDATMGNGHDTLFLAKLVGPTGAVLAYDIQEAALEATKQRLEKEGVLGHVRLYKKGHETVAQELRQLNRPVSAAMFNLGYLPGSDKRVVTKPDTTLAALEAIAPYLKPGGLITVVVYTGHDGGQEEGDALLARLSLWDHQHYHILQYRFLNRPNHPPYLVAIQKA